MALHSPLEGCEPNLCSHAPEVWPRAAGQGQALARCVMVLGTSSGAGKSWLTTALCRWYARQGLRVAPFKAQNMSNNARVVPTPDGGVGEVGSAQYFQALAAGVQPDVRMNPVLLKPEADTRSQVVLMGRVDRALGHTPWRERSAKVWPTVAQALLALRQTHDVVIIEGAGSPAEINLMDSDIVNLRVAREADAACLLVSDIDRGGAFAHLYGTWALLPDADRQRLRGFVLNKFRGDEALLAPAPEQLQALTGVPTVATLPMLHLHGLPEEDGWFEPHGAGSTPSPLAAAAGARPTHPKTVAVVAYPRISNLDEFQPLRHAQGLRLVWARTPADLAGADCIVLPGSKSTLADLAWMRDQRLDAAVCDHARRGGAVLGICGGLQMLGEALVDPDGVEAGGGNAPGLGLLPLVTRFDATKTLKTADVLFGHLPPGPWQALSGLRVQGYEIHQGQTRLHPGLVAAGHLASAALPGDGGWVSANGAVLGVYLHGLLECPAFVQAWLGAAAAPPMDDVFNRLADCVDQRFGPKVLNGLLASDAPAPEGVSRAMAAVAD